MYTEEEIAKELFVDAMRTAENLDSLTEDQLKGGLRTVARIAYIAAEVFVDYTSEWEGTARGRPLATLVR